MLRALRPRSPNPLILVSDLIDGAMKIWNHQKVREHLQPPDAQVVLNTPLSSHNLEDSWAWNYDMSRVLLLDQLTGC